MIREERTPTTHKQDRAFAPTTTPNVVLRAVPQVAADAMRPAPDHQSPVTPRESVPTLSTQSADPGQDTESTGFAQAVATVKYQLTFACEEQPRVFERDRMLGEDMPDAYTPGATVVGEWYGGDVLEDDAPVEQWLEHFARMAVGEAVHEALEWLRVHDRPWLDPHGPHERKIHQLTEEFVAQLAALRHRQADTPGTER
ncbi:MULTISPECIES: hypothetical protein [Actinosynnema]|uniref:hypothetical protein n=1 Tax=Actinosynnema TaxID=40566 RepID=UPI0020A41B80|nr:hypothetical protein [Actinosynnema pretiosum]MCP2097328.1 hypothetical protein [Actinosynnema pretiosum]